MRSAGTATILNDGSATRASFLGSTRRFDKPSAIDTTVVSQGLVSFKNWRTHDQATSDHFMITFEMSTPHTLPPLVPAQHPGRRLLSKSLCRQHETKLVQCLREEAKKLNLISNHITDAVTSITQAFTRAADNAGVLAPAPNAKKTRRQGMTNQCIQLRKVKRRAEQQVRKIILPQGKRSPGLSTEQLRSDPCFLAAKENLKNATKHLTTALRQSKQKRWQDFVAGLDLSTRPTNVWREIKKLQAASNQPQQASTLADDQGILWSPQEQCNALARHFSDISKNALTTTSPLPNNSPPSTTAAKQKTKSTAFQPPPPTTALAPAHVSEPAASPTTRCRLASLDAPDGRVSGTDLAVVPPQPIPDCSAPPPSDARQRLPKLTYHPGKCIPPPWCPPLSDPFPHPSETLPTQPAYDPPHLRYSPHPNQKKRQGPPSHAYDVLSCSEAMATALCSNQPAENSQHSCPSPSPSLITTSADLYRYKPLLPRPDSHHPDLPDHLVRLETTTEVHSKVERFMRDLDTEMTHRPPPFITMPSTHAGTGISRPFLMTELKRALTCVKSWSAPGEDALPYYILKLAPPELLSHVLILNSNTLNCSFFPPQWKQALMIPIPKVPSPSSLSDFRPISLLSCLSKILERMIERRFSHHLETQGTLKPSQGGFRSLRSAEEQAVSIIQAAHESWDRGRDHLLITLDIRKAFDTVWREGLIWKIFNEARIKGPLGLWMADYLTGRTMSCHYKGCKSPFLPMPNGVPQGAVLSPSFFTLYVNDLTVGLPADAPLPQFADDAALQTDIPRRSSTGRRAKLRNVQVVLDRISAWFMLWHLTLSPEKTSIRILHPHQKARTHDISFKIQGVTKTHSTASSTRYLGIHIDNRLTFKDHVLKAIEKASARVSVLRSISNSTWGTDPSTKQRLYNSWIRPVLEYGSLVLSSAPRAILRLLDKCQKECLLIVLGAQKTVSLPALELISGTDSLDLRRLIRWASLASKLQRSPPSPLAAMWCRFCSTKTNVTKSKLITLPYTFAKNMKGCRRISPLLMALSISDHLLTKPQDLFPTPLLVDSLCPWNPDPVYVPFPILPSSQDLSRPILGSASSRSPEQRREALVYANSRISSAVELGHLVAVTDGSARPLPQPQGGGGIGMILSADGASPLVVQGAPSGVLVTNISTEISAIQMALDYFDAATSHLPALPRSLLLANNLLRAVSQEETKKNKKKSDGKPLLAEPQACSLEEKEKDPASPLHHLSQSRTQSPAVAKKDNKPPPPPSPQPLSVPDLVKSSKGFTILSDCKYAVDACTTFATARDVYWVEARKAQATISRIKSRNIQLEVDWIPGHCDHPLGDLADTTAKAHSTNVLEPSLASTATSTPTRW